MEALHSGLMGEIKRSNAVQWLKKNVVVEIVAESFNLQLPIRYRFMRLITRSNHMRRAAISYHAHKSRPSIETLKETAFPQLDVGGTVGHLAEKGYATGLILPRDYINEILAFCRGADYIDDYSMEPLAIDPVDATLPRTGRLTYRCPNPHKQCETINKLTRDPVLVDVARGYLGAEPILRSSRIFWSYPDLSEDYNPLYGFHYDIDDYKFLKLFFYLCDVDLNRGPHVIIEGTHKVKSWFEKNHRRLTDKQAETLYSDRIRVMTYPIGHGFFEDTFCYHKGSKPRQRRLLLEFQYAVSAAAIL